MRTVGSDCMEEYTSSLTEYVESASEASLQRAHDLGRRLMSRGRGLLDVVAIHHAALVELLRPHQGAEEAERVARAACTFLAEALAPFEMAYRGFKEVNARLREMNASLDRLVTQRTEELRKREGEVIQLQKMEAIGRLAGGVAHDFNNLLTAINGYTDLLLKKTPDDHPDREDLLEVRKAGERGSALTRQLLAFGRRQVFSMLVVDLDSVVAEMEKMLRRLIGEDIDLVVSPAPAPARVRADPSQLQQVLLNLAVNARDAMRGGGRLELVTSFETVGEAGARADLPDGRYVVLRVTDTGAGMDAETLARVFEPFFTTKGSGVGTGLGLAMVYGIVRQSGGAIRVESEPGKGTTFRIHLPLAAEEPEDWTAAETVLDWAVGTETILLCEDDDLVRRLARLILTSHGYTVLETRNGDEAIEAFVRSGDAVDLLLSDVVMPRMGGAELASRLSALRPGLPVLLISGYPEGADPQRALLSKPFTPPDLLRRVREVLDGRRTHGDAPG
ncbi:MAG: ATP-binding protein [Planctomycetota bacterium]